MRVRCVTIEGELYETGTLTGGSRNQQQPVLQQLHQLNQYKQQLHDLERRKTEIEEDNVNANQYHNLKQQHQIKQHEKELLHQRLTSTASHQLQSKIVQMENQLDHFIPLVQELAN